MTIKKATAYKRREKIYLHPTSQTAGGLGLFDEPAIIVLEQDVKQVGAMLLETLNHSKQGLPMPTSWEGFGDSLYKLAGVKTWSAFAKNAKCVGIELQNNILTMRPERNMGEKQGFKRIEDKIHQITLSSPEIAGFALLAAFDDAE